MKKPKMRIALFLLAVMLCMAAFSVSAFAVPEEDLPPVEEAPVESEGTEEALSFEDFFSGLGDAFSSFTPEGNLTLVDDFTIPVSSEDGTRSVKQFITVQSKSGNTFYIIIDRAGERENVYFLNLVDEKDLLALMDEPPRDDDPAPLICTCADKCHVGHIDTSCPVCAVNLSECAGKEAALETAAEQATGTQPSGQSSAGKGNMTVYLLLALVFAAVIGGVIFYFVKARGKGKTVSRRNAAEKGRDEDDEELYFPADQEDEE